MTIQEYKEKIIHTIEQMEKEHKMSVERIEIDTEVADLGYGNYSTKRNFKMLVK